MRHVLRRAPLALPAGSPATPHESDSGRLLLPLLPPAHQPGREGRAGKTAGKPDGQRDQLLPQPAAARAVSETDSGRAAAPETGAARLDAAVLVRGLLHRAGAL